MANICSIKVFMPLSKVPNTKERVGLKALYKAEEKWSKAAKKDKHLRTGRNKDEFIAKQPGVPSEITRWGSYGGWYKGRNGEKLNPPSKQWNRPTINASFFKRNKSVWVYPFGLGKGEGLLFDESKGITVEYEDPNFETKSYQRVPVSWDFKWSFPWWAQVGFAGAKKYCNKDSKDAPKGKSDDFYKKWFEKHGHPFAYLVWKLEVGKITKNLEFVIGVYEEFPIKGPAWKWSWIWKNLNNINKLYRWLKKIEIAVPEAIVELDWSEVAWNMMSYEEARENDDPNRIMESIKNTRSDIKKVNKKEISWKSFVNKYGDKITTRKGKKDLYIQIKKRNPFDYLLWL